MADRALVSIVTPTRNQARFLEATLRSVRGQTYPRVEHIVIDGASTDATIEILRREGERGEVRWQSELDAGMYDALGKGLALATGDVLGYLNSDDAYLPWAIETAMDVFAAQPDVDVVYGDGIKVEENTGVQRLRLFPPFEAARLAHHESLMQPAVFWRRRVLDRIGAFDAGLRYVADLDYWLRAAAAGARFRHVDEVIAVERLHGERLSSAQEDAMAEEDRAMRARHVAESGDDAGRDRALRRHRRLMRARWLRFLAAAGLRGAAPGWRRFLRDGDVHIRWRRAIRGSQPYRYRRLGNAVRSDLAVRVLAAEDAPHVG